MLAGWASGIWLVSASSDQYGRLKPFMRMTFFHLVLTTALMIFIEKSKPGADREELLMFGILIFLYGVSRGSNILGLVLLCEHFPKKYTTLICTTRNLVDAISQATWIFYF